MQTDESKAAWIEGGRCGDSPHSPTGRAKGTSMVPLGLLEAAKGYRERKILSMNAISTSEHYVLVVKNLPANVGDIRHGFNPWVGKIPCRRKWQPTPVFLSGQAHGQRSLVGYSPWGPKESDTNEHLSTQHTLCVLGMWKWKMTPLPSRSSEFMEKKRKITCL